MRKEMVARFVTETGQRANSGSRAFFPRRPDWIMCRVKSPSGRSVSAAWDSLSKTHYALAKIYIARSPHTHTHTSLPQPPPSPFSCMVYCQTHYYALAEMHLMMTRQHDPKSKTVLPTCSSRQNKEADEVSDQCLPCIHNTTPPKLICPGKTNPLVTSLRRHGTLNLNRNDVCWEICSGCR